MAERVRVSGKNTQVSENEGIDAQVDSTYDALHVKSHLFGFDGIGFSNPIKVDSDGKIKVSINANTQQERFDYDTRNDGQPVYAGFANSGLATDSTLWTLHKFTYNTEGFITLKQTSIDSWDNRDGATYA